VHLYRRPPSHLVASSGHTGAAGARGEAKNARPPNCHAGPGVVFEGELNRSKETCEQLMYSIAGVVGKNVGRESQ
jgi:hypothetical protein